MNKADEWLNYLMFTVILMAISSLGVDLVGGVWNQIFLMSTGATLVILAFTMAVVRDYEPLAKYAYSYTEGDSDE